MPLAELLSSSQCPFNKIAPQSFFQQFRLAAINSSDHLRHLIKKGHRRNSLVSVSDLGMVTPGCLKKSCQPLPVLDLGTDVRSYVGSRSLSLSLASRLSMSMTTTPDTAPVTIPTLFKSSLIGPPPGVRPVCRKFAFSAAAGSAEPWSEQCCVKTRTQSAPLGLRPAEARRGQPWTREALLRAGI